MSERERPAHPDATGLHRSETEPSAIALSEILASAGLRAALHKLSGDSEPASALQALVEEYGRATLSSAAILMADGSGATAANRWVYEATPNAGDGADG